jgi:transposase-like protein
MAKHYPFEQRERAVRMVLDHVDEYRSVYAACVAIGPKVGVGVESLRRWVCRPRLTAPIGRASPLPRRSGSEILSAKYEISRRPTRF